MADHKQASGVSDIAPLVARAQGCLLGQLAGDALGSLVEFQSPATIRAAYPNGVRELADGGCWNTIAGQPTDDSEMALALARTLAEHGTYSAKRTRCAYERWLDSDPFDAGCTVTRGLTGDPNWDSEANGALMRVSPLGIFGARFAPEEVARWAERDAAITHPNPVCRQASAVFACAIAYAVRTGCTPDALYESIVDQAKAIPAEPPLLEAIQRAADTPPRDFMTSMGWVLIALRNALWQLLHAASLEEGVVDTVMRGGDTDTNAAIAGALLGAVHGRDAVPAQWVECLLACRPQKGRPEVFRPRPQCYWPVDALELAERLVHPPAGIGV